jgi:hypothetical protein
VLTVSTVLPEDGDMDRCATKANTETTTISAIQASTRPTTNRPSYWIVPDWWMLNHIYERTKTLKLDQRPSGTKHFGIQPALVAEWHDRWDLLGIFPDV